MEDPTPAADRLRRQRQKAGWTQVQLADRADLAVDTIQSLEQGRRRFTNEVLVRLATAFDESFEVFVSLLGLRTRRDVLKQSGHAAVAAGIAIGAATRERGAARGSLRRGWDEQIADAERGLTAIARPTFDGIRENYDAMLSYTDRLLERYEGLDDERAIRIVARSLLLQGAAESEQTEPAATGRQRFALAATLAHQIGDKGLELETLFLQAQHLRKVAEVSGNSDDETRAATLLTSIEQEGGHPVFRAWALTERAKMSITHGRQIAYEEAMRQAASALENRCDVPTITLWPSFLADYIRVYFIDVRLRGIAGFARDVVEKDALEEMWRLAVRARHYPHALTTNIDKATIPLSLASALLRSENPRERKQGLMLWWSSWQAADAYGLPKHRWRAFLLLQHPAVRDNLPTELRVRCLNCRWSAEIPDVELDQQGRCGSCGSLALLVTS